MEIRISGNSRKAEGDGQMTTTSLSRVLLLLTGAQGLQFSTLPTASY